MFVVENLQLQLNSTYIYYQNPNPINIRQVSNIPAWGLPLYHGPVLRSQSALNSLDPAGDKNPSIPWLRYSFCLIPKISSLCSTPPSEY